MLKEQRRKDIESLYTVGVIPRRGDKGILLGCGISNEKILAFTFYYISQK